MPEGARNLNIDYVDDFPGELVRSPRYRLRELGRHERKKKGKKGKKRLAPIPVRIVISACLDNRVSFRNERATASTYVDLFFPIAANAAVAHRVRVSPDAVREIALKLP